MAFPSRGQWKPRSSFGRGTMRELNLPYAKCVYDTALLCTELFLIWGNLHYKCNFTWGTDYKVHFNLLQHPQFWPQICVTGVEDISLHFTDGKTEVQRNGDKVQDHTHEDSQVSDSWPHAFCSIQPLYMYHAQPLHVPCTASLHVPGTVKGAYVGPGSNTIYLKVVHIDWTLSQA